MRLNKGGEGSGIKGHTTAHLQTRAEFAQSVAATHGLKPEHLTMMQTKEAHDESLYGHRHNISDPEPPRLDAAGYRELRQAGLIAPRKGYGSSHILTPKGRAAYRDFMQHENHIVAALRRGEAVPAAVLADYPNAAKTGATPAPPPRYMTPKQARDLLPPGVGGFVSEQAKQAHTNRIGFTLSDKIYGDEDTRLEGFSAQRDAQGELTGQYESTGSFHIGGEWGGYNNVNAIGRVINVPVGSYLVQTGYAGGKGYVRVIHNNGQKLLKDLHTSVRVAVCADNKVKNANSY